MNDASERLLVIVGAGRQGRIVRDVAEVLDIPMAGFLDDTKQPGDTINGLTVLGGFDRIEDADLLRTSTWIVALGDCQARGKLSKNIRDRGGQFRTLIHPNCFISPSAQIGEGVFIQAFSRILANARLSDFAVVDGQASVGVDVVIGESGFVGPACMMIGGSSTEANVFLGLNSTVATQAPVGRNSIVGAGAVVVDGIPENSVAVGNPARVIRTLPTE